MRVVKEIEVVTCDMCGYEDPPGCCTPVTIDGKQLDVCSCCFPKLEPSLKFLATGLGLSIQWGAQDAES